MRLRYIYLYSIHFASRDSQMNENILIKLTNGHVQHILAAQFILGFSSLY